MEREYASMLGCSGPIKVKRPSDDIGTISIYHEWLYMSFMCQCFLFGNLPYYEFL